MAVRSTYEPLDSSILEPVDIDSGSGGRFEDPFYGDRVRTHKGNYIVRLRPSDFVNRFIRVKDGDSGEIVPISFEERGYLKRPYDTGAKKMLLMMSRQTEKSTTLGNKLLQRGAMNPGRGSLFVTPSAMQTTVFSKTRVSDIIDISPVIQGLTSQRLTNNILEREFINKSRIYLRYAFLTADRIRGLSVGDVFCDEIQDLLAENMPVIEETASHYKKPFFCYSGTPKTFDNTIEHYWSKASTQSEWIIPCQHHGTPKDPASWHWNVVGEKNLGKKGPICDRCGNALNPEHEWARWCAMNPGAEFEGFRICRLMVPWFFKDQDKWKTVLQSYERYPRAQFFNEILALSYDSGTKPISRLDLIRACDNRYNNTEEQAAEIAKNYPTWIGIDWGTGENTYTVMSVVSYCRNDDSLQVIFMKRFDGPLTDPDLQLREIKRLAARFNFKFIGADYGQGFVQNHDLVTTYGGKRVQRFQYAARAPGKFTFSPKLMRFIVFRTPVMADIFGALKRKKIRLPSWKRIEHPHGDDILSIFQEYSETMKMLKFDTPKGVPDDSFHSILYATLVSMLSIKRPDIISPRKDKSSRTEKRMGAYEVDLMEQYDPLTEVQ
jgi:hypothetical protein